MTIEGARPLQTLKGSDPSRAIEDRRRGDGPLMAACADGGTRTGVRRLVPPQGGLDGTETGRQAGDGDRGAGRCADRAFGGRGGIPWLDRLAADEIGRASCRERGEIA